MLSFGGIYVCYRSGAYLYALVGGIYVCYRSGAYTYAIDYRGRIRACYHLKGAHLCLLPIGSASVRIE